MLFKQRGFNHEREEFHEALQVSDEMRIAIREKVFFSSFSNALQAMELFIILPPILLERLVSYITTLLIMS